MYIKQKQSPFLDLFCQLKLASHLIYDEKNIELSKTACFIVFFILDPIRKYTRCPFTTKNYVSCYVFITTDACFISKITKSVSYAGIFHALTSHVAKASTITIINSRFLFLLMHRYSQPILGMRRLSIRIRVQMNNHIHVKVWDVINYPCTGVNDGLAKPLLKLGIWVSNNSPRKQWMWLLGVGVPHRSRYFLSQKLWHIHKNIRSCVEIECCCPRTVNISHVLILFQKYPFSNSS